MLLRTQPLAALGAALLAGCMEDPFPRFDPYGPSGGNRGWSEVRLYQGDSWERAHLAKISDALGEPLTLRSPPAKKTNAAARALTTMRPEAMGVLCRHPGTAGPPLLAMLGDGDAVARRVAVTALGDLGGPVEPMSEIRRALWTAALRDTDVKVRDCAARAFDLQFGCWGTEQIPSAAEVVVALRTEPDVEVRGSLVFLLGDRPGDPAAVIPAVLASGVDAETGRCGILRHVKPECLSLLDRGFREAPPLGRAAIGDALFCSHATGPWAEDLVRAGLADPDEAVRDRFSRAHFALDVRRIHAAEAAGR